VIIGLESRIISDSDSTHYFPRVSQIQMQLPYVANLNLGKFQVRYLKETGIMKIVPEKLYPKKGHNNIIVTAFTAGSQSFVSKFCSPHLLKYQNLAILIREIKYSGTLFGLFPRSDKVTRIYTRKKNK
jgi:hypothetical protein